MRMKNMPTTKASIVANLKNHINFEAPLLPASINRRANDKSTLESAIDLNELLSKNNKSTYLVRVSGESMIDENIFTDDILIVDAKEMPKDGQIVIASLDGELTVKKLRKIDNKIYLFSANEKFVPIEITPYCKFDIQGVVKHIIHSI